MKRISFIVLFLIALISCNREHAFSPEARHNLVFDSLAVTWDEAIPLGNGELGALIWNHNGHLRFSLDRSDLWDLRPIAYLEKKEFNFNWVYQKWAEDDYGIVQEFFDRGAYSNSIAPSKIPGAALEFSFPGVKDPVHVELDLRTAVCHVSWANGVELESFIKADSPEGWFRLTGLSEDPEIELVPPQYRKVMEDNRADEVTGQDLRRLGYKQGLVEKGNNKVTYHQVGWGGFYYDVAVVWKKKGKTLTGSWSVTSSISTAKGLPTAGEIVQQGNYYGALRLHEKWWKEFYDHSGIRIPDPVLEKQWYLEQYKFGSAARSNTPPISLQAVWTADNGRMPPWKGDFHHDLNTQLSYWPAYSSNHLDLEIGFLNWLWSIKPVAEQYTQSYFGVEGLNVPGVTTLTGHPMGGWIQYSCGPTVSAWLGQHFYLHWRYSMDTSFLKNRAYPWMAQTATFLENFSVKDENGVRKLPLSSSPEIFNNSRRAWFSQTTNFDLGLIRFAFSKAAEMATVLGKEKEAAHWKEMLGEWPGYSVDSSGLNFAPGVPYQFSHRHFSHLLAWHPLGLIDWSRGAGDQQIIKNTLATLEKYGPDWWTGYSYSWLGNLYARAFMGNKAAQALRDFAQCFCLPNSFHVNGDQTRSGKSKFTYRPFTLEGNFAFAAGVQEMLIQSHTGIIRVFPAIPDDWADCSFNDLRAEGAFIVSAEYKNSRVTRVKIRAEKGGICRLADPAHPDEVIEYRMKPGESKVWKNPF